MLAVGITEEMKNVIAAFSGLADSYLVKLIKKE
jgi:hypothetical protein